MVRIVLAAMLGVVLGAFLYMPAAIYYVHKFQGKCEISNGVTIRGHNSTLYCVKPDDIILKEVIYEEFFNSFDADD